MMRATDQHIWPGRAALDAWPIPEAGLNHRAVHCLTTAGVRTVGELRGRSDRDLLRLPHFGGQSLHNVQWFFHWTRRIEKQNVPLLSLPDLLAELLNEQEVGVLEQRYGLTDPLFRPHLKWRTLQAIADASGGLTRERVRQVEEAATTTLRCRLSRALLSPLETHWVRRLAAQGGIVTCRELADWAGDPGLGRYEPWGALRLLADVGQRLHNYFDYFALLPPDTMSRVETRTRELLQAAPEPQSLARLLAVLPPEFGQQPGDRARLLTVLLEHHPAIDATRAGAYFLGDKAAAWFLTGLLRDAGSAVPLETLRQRYNEQMLPPSQKSPQAIARVLSQLPPVKRVSAALYQWREKD